MATPDLWQQADWQGAVLSFCRLGRQHGLPVGVQESLSALAVCRFGPLHEREYLRHSLRALLCASRQDVDKFEELFEAYWHTDPKRPRRFANDRPAVNPLGVVTRRTNRSIMTLLGQGETPSNETREDNEVAGASLQESLRRTDFSQVPFGQTDALERLTERLAWQLSARLSRRLQPSSKQELISLRGTLRRNLQHGGEPLELAFRRRRLRKPSLVALLDISGSMDQYSLFFLRFLHALQQSFRQMDAYLFSTRLTPISAKLRQQKFPDTLRRLSEREEAWSSGTKIGACLETFHAEHARPLLSRSAVVMILSDGYDTGEPERLERQLMRFRGKVRQLIWLNPMLGQPHYQPTTAGMQAALPWIDAFLPAHNLESLLALEQHISR
jgi:uncharacterized protein with von Willebrand factor type A (vWA) domain